jgi:hypothetical protein
MTLMKYTQLIALATAVGTVVGCSSEPRLTVTEPVGPGRSEAVRQGALQVYTATEQHASGDNTFYYPHTSYLIYNNQGQKVQSVVNHVGTMDESPSVVHLPAGSYVVWAEAEGYGRVRIPVVVTSSRTTVLHLERGWEPPKEAQPSDLVRMPDGQPIGWKSPGTAHSTSSSNQPGKPS